MSTFCAQRQNKRLLYHSISAKEERLPSWYEQKRLRIVFIESFLDRYLLDNVANHKLAQAASSSGLFQSLARDDSERSIVSANSLDFLVAGRIPTPSFLGLDF